MEKRKEQAQAILALVEQYIAERKTHRAQALESLTGLLTELTACHLPEAGEAEDEKLLAQAKVHVLAIEQCCDVVNGLHEKRAGTSPTKRACNSPPHPPLLPKSLAPTPLSLQAPSGEPNSTHLLNNTKE